MGKEQKINLRGFGTLTIIIIAATILVGGGFFGYQYLQLQKIREGAKPPAAETTIPPPSPEETQPQTGAIDTSNWKTYRNEEYGFEVKYPEDWDTREVSSKVFPTIRFSNTNETQNIFVASLKGVIYELSGCEILMGFAAQDGEDPPDTCENLSDFVIDWETDSARSKHMTVSFTSTSQKSQQSQALFRAFLSTFRFIP